MAEDTALDAYIDEAPEPARPHLRQLRRLILDTVPGATEKISYGMPTYEYGGRRLVHLAAAKKHVAIYALVHVDGEVPKELADYVDHRSTLHFRFEEPLPLPALAGALKAKAEAVEAGA